MVPDEFLTVQKVVRLGVSFTRNCAIRTNIQTPSPANLRSAKRRSNF
jgi:hypothetical protein